MNILTKILNNRLINEYAFLALFVIFYYLIRLSIFNSGWDGSDANGHDVDIFLNHRTGPNYLLIGQVDGAKMLGNPDHPALMYEIFSKLGYIFQIFIDHKSLSYPEIVYRIKVMVASIQLTFYIVFFWLIFQKVKSKSGRILTIILGCILASTPLAINSSNEFQLDSLIGWFTVGCISLTIAAASFRILRGIKLLIPLFLSALVISIGKNEWTLLLLTALVAAAIFLTTRAYLSPDKKNDLRKELTIVLVCIAGCIAGNLVSFLFDPANYMAGWHLLTRMSKGASILAENGFENFVRLTKERRIYLYAPALLLTYSTLELIRLKKIGAELVILYLISLGFFFGFFFSTWGAYPRYFSPAYIAIIIMSGIIYANHHQEYKINIRCLIFSALMLFIFANGIKYARSHQIRDQHQWGIKQLPANSNCIYSAPIEATYDGGEKINFIVSGMGQTFAEIVGDKHNLRLCEQ